MVRFGGLIKVDPNTGRVTNKAAVWVVFAPFLLIVIALITFLFIRTSQNTEFTGEDNSESLARIENVEEIDLTALSNLNAPATLDISENNQLIVNGELKANQAFVLAPGEEPDGPQSGQVYFDESGDVIRYYDGNGFVDLARDENICYIGAANCGFATSDELAAINVELPQALGVNDTPTFAGINLGAGLNVASGGTGTSTLTDNGVLLGKGTNPVQATAAPSSGQILIGNASGVPTFTTLGGDASLNGSGSLQINANTIGSSELTSTTVTAGSYGDGANYATFTVDADGRITSASTFAVPGGGGGVGSLNALSGALNLNGTANQITVVDNGTDTLTLSLPNDVTIPNNLTAGNNATVTSTLFLSALNCSLNANGGVLTTTGTGEVICGDDDTGGAGAPQDAVYLTIGNNGTLTDERGFLAGTNLSSTDGGANGNFTVDVVNNPSFSGLVTANGGLTVQTGDTFTFNGDAFTDLTGTGLSINSGALQTTLGVDISGGEIVDNTIEEVDLEVTNVPTDNYVLTYDATSGGFTWVDPTSVGVGANFDITDGVTTENIQNGDSVTFADGTNTNAVVSATDTVTISVSNNPSFSGLVTLNGGATVQVGDTFTFNGDPFTDFTGTGLTISGGALQTTLGTDIEGSEIANGTIEEIDLEVTNAPTDNYVLTYDSGTGGFTWVDPTTVGLVANSFETIDVPAGTDPVADASTDTLSLTAGANIVITGTAASDSIDFAVANNPTFSGLVTANGGLTVQVGDTFTFNSDAFTDLTGTGLTISGGALQTTLGTGVDGSEIDNNTIEEVDLEVTNSATDNYVLTYDSGTGGFTWVDPSGLGAGTNFDITDGTTTETVGNAETITFADGTNIDSVVTATDTVTVNVVSNPTFSGLITANGGITVEAGDTFNFNGDAFTDLTGTGLTISSGSLQTTLGTSVTLTSEVDGILPIANGGTGLSSVGSAGSLAYSNGTGIAFTGVGTTNQCLLSAGAGTPTWGSCTAGGGNSLQGAYDAGNTVTTTNARDVSVTLADTATDSDFIVNIATGSTSIFEIQDNGSSEFTVSTTGTTIDTLSLTNQLAIASGGTNATSIGAAGTVAYSTGTAYAFSGTGTAGQCLLSNGAGAPSFGNCSGSGTGAVTLQSAYQGGNTITTSDADDDITFTLADTTTDRDFIVDIASGSTSVIEFQNNGTAVLRADSSGVDLIDVDSADFSGATVTFDSGEIVNSELANSSVTITAGTGLTGGGAVSLGGSTSLNVSLGTDIIGSEIVNNTIEEVDLEVTNSATDNYVLTYDSSSGGFTWVDPSTVGVDNQSLFETFDAPAGTDPVADSNTDTLSLTNGTNVSITGNATTDTLDFAVVDNPTFAGLITANGSLTLQTGDTLTVNGEGFTDLTGTGLTISGSSLVTTLGTGVDGSEIDNNTIEEVDLEVTNSATDNYVLTYDSTSGGFTWVDPSSVGVDNQSLFETFNAPAGTDPVADSSTDTINFTNGSNISITGNATTDTIDVAVTSTPTFTGLVTANGGVTIEAGDTFTFNSDAFTDLTGTGLQISGGVLETTLGTSIAGGEITNNTIEEVDLEVTNSATDNYILSYDSSSGGFTWVDPSGVGGSSSFDITDGVTTQTINSTDTVTFADGTNTDAVVTATDTVTYNIVNNPTFSGLLTANGNLTVQTGDTFTVNGDAFTDLTGDGLTISGGALQSTLGTSITGSEITDNTIEEADLEVTNAPTDNFVLTYDSGTGGFTWVAGSTFDTDTDNQNLYSTFDVPSGTDPVADSSSETLTFADGSNITISGVAATDTITVAVDSAPTFSGLVTANGNLTIQTGDTFTINGEGFTDLTGTGLTNSGNTLATTLGTSITLTSEVDGILPVGNGGTGASSLTAGGVLFGNGSSAITNSGVLGNGQLLIGDGTGAPSVANLTQGTGITISNGAGTITIASTLGTAIIGSEITDGTIEEVDLEVTNSPTNNYVLTYDSGTGGFTWVDPNTLGTDTNTFASVQVDGVTLSGAAPVLDLSGTDFVVTESPTDDFDITLQDERIEDIIGTALTAGTQTDITVTYQDGTNDFDLVVDTLPNLTGTLDVNSGGTGVTTITDGGILLGSGTGAISNTGVLGNGQLLIGDGSGDPTVATLTQGTGITITNGAGSITVASTLGTAIIGSEITNNTIEEVDLEVTNSATDNYLLSYDSGTGGFTWVEGSSSNTRAVYLVPEYPGLTLVPDGSNNTGTMTSDFCSGTSGLSVNTSVCAASDNHNYFSWTTAESTAQDYDIFVRYKVPSDFSSFTSSSTITMDGWRTDSTNNMVELALFDDTMTQCGTTTNVATGTATWSNVALGGDETGCGITAEEVITFRIRMTADQNDFARAGAIEFSYNTAW